MKLCQHCGHWNLRPHAILFCDSCGKPLSPRGTVHPPAGDKVRGVDGNIRASGKTPRQKRDDT